MRSPSACLVMLGSVLGLKGTSSKKFAAMRPKRRAMALIGSGLAIGGFGRAVRRWATAVVAEAPSHPAFELLRTEDVEELDARCYVYEHAKTKAQIMSVVTPEENKVFGVVFRTPPADSTGLPHILEHSVLCGSEQFPTKEPFVELLKGSLQTFLNAFTYPDRTCYPVASQNNKDLKNLATVYLDAVFKPRAVSDPYVLKQEGWHYEVNDDLLEYKGVVYNEMKGVYSNPDALLNRAAQQALFPDNTYAVDSGGDPLKIPDLTFNDFTDFHAKYYTASNAKIFFYGDDDPIERLQFLDDYLSKLPSSDSVSKDTLISSQKLNIQEPRYEQHPFPSAESQHMISVNWLLTDEQLKPDEELGLALLDHLLVGTPSSTLRKALTDSGLGESVLGGGLSDELIQPTFTMGLKGVNQDNVAKVEPLILETLQGVVKKGGFDADDIAASLNTIEFQLREFNTGSFPKGLSFMLGVMRNWIYERDPVEAVRFEEPLAVLKENLKQENYLSSLIEKYLLQNTHRVSIEMVPDADMEAREAADEAARLKALREEMDESQLKQVKEEMQILQERQAEADSQEALATIPTLDVRSDIEPKVKSIERREDTLSQHTTVLRRTLPTAGILYADLALDLRSVLDPVTEIPLVPLFTRMLTETGTSSYDAVTLRRMIGAETGGLSAAALATMRVSDVITEPEDIVYRLVIRGKCTKDKSQNLFDLMTSILTDADFKNAQQRVIEMLKETKAGYESAFRTSGQQFAAARIGASLTRAGYINEMSSGLSHYYSVLEALESAQSNWPDFIAKLETMRTKILEHCDLIINLTGDEATLDMAPVDTLQKKLEAFAVKDKYTAKDWAVVAPLEDMKKKNEGFAVPTQVNYVAKGGRFYSVGQSPRGQDAVIRRVLSLDYLWNRVRVMGGAYGGSCSVNPTTGTFAFSSYRDPNLEETLTTYDHAVQYLNELEIDQTELDKAIIATIGELDNPLTNDQKGFVSLRHYLDGTTDAVRQKWRDEVLATSKSDFKAFAQELNTMLKHNAKSVVFASAAALDEASKSLPKHNQLEVTTLIN